MTVASQVKQTLAGLKSAEAVLRIYATQNQSKEVQDVFIEATGILEQIHKEIEERLQTLELEEPQYKGM